jgi:type VI secretion system protein ImpG
MDSRLLHHYNNELHFMREMGSEFADAFPKIAGRLGLEGLECADPYVERLLEGFAFLTARVQLKIEDEFPNFCQHLMEIVFPDYLAPIPSMTVVHMQPDYGDPDLAQGFTLPRQTVLRSGMASKAQTQCEYRTAHEVTLFPIKVAEAEYIATRAAMSKMGIRPERSVVAGIRIRLEAQGDAPFGEFDMDELPLFLHGSGTIPLWLYEQILGNSSALSLVDRGKGAKKPVTLDSSHIQRCGFDSEDALMPFRSRSFEGYRLLQEYFQFPERFRFVKLTGLKKAMSGFKGKSLDIVIQLTQRQADLENVVDETNFMPFCTPAINLFPMRADRININQKDWEFHVVPDRGRPMDYEVAHVLRVTGYGAKTQDEQTFRPFYALKDRDDGSGQAAFYSMRRMPRLQSQRQKLRGGRSAYLGQEIYVSLVDSNEKPFSTDLKQLGLQVMCTNRDLPMHIPLGQKKGDFSLQKNAPVKLVKCIAGPTRPRSATRKGEEAWRVISHMALNYLSLLDEDEEQGAAALRELLMLYATGNRLGERHVNGLISIKAKPVSRRIPIPGPISFGRGLELTIILEEEAFEAGGMYMFGSILEEYFSKYVSVNNLTETRVVSNHQNEIAKWPVRMGYRPVL